MEEERKEVRAMLFMVTMTHTAESCPGNNPQKMPEAMVTNALKEGVS